MLEITPQERLALGVTAILLAAGIGARVLSDSALRSGDALVVQGVAAGVAGSAPPVGAARERLAEERLRSRPLAEGERLDPNSATVIELQRLPRVGPALATRIVAHREANGPFRSLADLDAVPGVGPAMLTAMAPLLTLPESAPPPVAGAGQLSAGQRAEVGRSAGSAGGAGFSGSSEGRIDVNRASAAELESLPGIGPAIARRMVEWREANGPFRTPADLEKVPGIGPRLRERLEPRVRLPS